MGNARVNRNDSNRPQQVSNSASRVNNASTSTTAPTDPASREKFMKQHLIFLLHSSKCDARDKERINQGNAVIPVSSN